MQQGLLWLVYQGLIDRVEQFVLGVEDIVQEANGEFAAAAMRRVVAFATIFPRSPSRRLNKVLPAHFGPSSHSASPASSVLPPGDWSAVDRDEC